MSEPNSKRPKLATENDTATAGAGHQGLLPLRPSLPADHATRRAAQRALAAQAWDAWAATDAAATATRVALLKSLDDASGAFYRAHLERASSDGGGADAAARHAEALRVVFDSNLAGVTEGTPRFFEVLALKCDRMALCRDMVAKALEEKGEASGFDAFERALIAGSAAISQAYDNFWAAWMRAVQHPAVLAALDDASPATMASREACGPALLSPYTIIRVAKAADGDGHRFAAEPYATFFGASVLPPVLAAFDACADGLAAAIAAAGGGDAGATAMLAFMRAYRAALAATGDAAALEAAWAAVDRAWMDCKGPLQVVHDIEDGYSDPLRAKQGPDFSLRFLDESYASENATIRDIHGHICAYYEGRGTPLSRDGLTALANTSAGIYYIPFKTGCSLVFSYSGQSIPNRLDVKKEKGVKIYFDAIETAARVEQVKKKTASVFADAPALLARWAPDAVEQLVWHVAAHEVGPVKILQRTFLD